MKVPSGAANTLGAALDWRVEMRQKFTSLAEKLEAFSDRSGGPDSCWIWLRAKSNGYGKLWFGGAYRLAHRSSWEVAYGPIPDGMMICHTCDNPSCINPRHFFLGTAQDNAHDMVRKGRATQRAGFGEANPHAKVTSEHVKQMRARYRAGDVTLAELGAEYGICFSAVSQIVNRHVWKHVE